MVRDMAHIPLPAVSRRKWRIFRYSRPLFAAGIVLLFFVPPMMAAFSNKNENNTLHQ